MFTVNATFESNSFLGRIHLAANLCGLTHCRLLCNQPVTNLDLLPPSLSTNIILNAHSQLLDFIAEKRHTFDLPLAPSGTPFQLKVLRALQHIPFGHTISYKELAASIGAPNAFRAVARANAANPIAIIIPCHRVISSSGNLGGYSLHNHKTSSEGLAVKRKLLLLEKRNLLFPPS